MATTRPSATTTYPFRVTTYTNPSPSTPSSYLTTYTDTTLRPPTSADPKCSSAAQYPSIQGPSGLKAACVISNAADINPHAYWDVYECCPGHDITASGYGVTGGEIAVPAICMMQCTINDNSTTWQEVGECLQKRVKKVVCGPRFEEANRNGTFGSQKSTQAGVTVSATRTGGDDTTSSPTAARSTGAAASVDVVHATTSKFGIFILGLLGVVSAAGLVL